MIGLDLFSRPRQASQITAEMVSFPKDATEDARCILSVAISMAGWSTSGVTGAEAWGNAATFLQLACIHWVQLKGPLTKSSFVTTRILYN